MAELPIAGLNRGRFRLLVCRSLAPHLHRFVKRHHPHSLLDGRVARLFSLPVDGRFTCPADSRAAIERNVFAEDGVRHIQDRVLLRDFQCLVVDLDLHFFLG